MSPEVAAYSQVAVITVGLVGSLAGITVAMVRGLNPRRPSSLPPQADVHSEQLAQLQQSVDAIALEVERIAEAQRFSAKLLAERVAERSDV